jgi:hypothetical protein
VQVTTPAAVTALTEVQAVKAALGVSSSKFDKALERLINAATDAIQDYVGHVYAKQTYTETVAGSGHPVLLLTNVPIIGIPVVTAGGSPVVDFIVQDALVGSLYRQVGWAQGAWIGWYTEPRRVQGTEGLNFSVVYEAGYVMPTDEDRTLPAAVEQACITTVVAWYKGSARDPRVKMKKVGDLSITYGDPNEDALALPAAARALLSRRVK